MDISPLEKVIDDALQGRFVHHLMAITKPEHLLEYVNVLYFRPKPTEASPVRISQHSEQIPEELEPYPSGYNLLSIRNELQKWSHADQEAFVVFLNSARINAYLTEALDVVRQHQEHLAGHTSFSGLLALWWQMGCHPLQERFDD